MPTRRQVATVPIRGSVVLEEEHADGAIIRHNPSRAAIAMDDHDDDQDKQESSEEEEEAEPSNSDSENEDMDADSESEQEQVRRSSRRSRRGKPLKEVDDPPNDGNRRRTSSRSNKFKSSMKEPSGDSIKDLLQGESANVNQGSTKRSARRKRRASSSESNSQDDSSDDDESPPSSPERRTSSRSTKFKSSMKEPNGIADLFQTESSSTRKSGGRSSKVTMDADGSDDEPVTPPRRTSKRVPKSPAVRHSSERRRFKTEVLVSSDEESSTYDSDVVSSEEEEEDQLKIQRILASRSETRQTWRELGKAINTSEIDYGSRWFQEETADEKAASAEVFEERFLVKWSDLSYLHCSWETQDDLVEQVDSAKTYLTTFFRKSENGILFTADERCDGDYFDPAYCQIDRILEVYLPDNVKPSRKSKGDEDVLTKYGIVMDKSDPEFESGTGRQFLIKWCNTPYSDCTYEFERDLILNDIEYKEHVDAFFRRSKKPSKMEMKKALKSGEDEFRRTYKIFGDRVNLSQQRREERAKEYQKQLEDREFPNGGQLRDYQAEGVSWLLANHINKRSSILADEMGLGKTLQTAIYINLVASRLKRRGPFLIVAPLSTLAHWRREFASWTDFNTIVYHGSAKDRELIREFEIAFECDRPKNGVAFNQSYLRKCMPKSRPTLERSWMAQVVITTPEMLVTDDYSELTAVQWEVLVVDEAHRLKNHTSKLANNLRDDRFSFKHKLLLTGTPIQNNMTELWTLMNIINPDKFDSMDEFLEKYGDIKSKERIDELHEGIRPYILRRLKEDVEKSVPPKEETLIEVELTLLQKQYYRALYEKNVAFLHRNKKKALDGPSLNNLAMQLRKCCLHPFLLNGVENDVRSQENTENPNWSEADFLVKASGKLVLLDKLLPKLKENGHRVLLFSQFKIMLDILEDYLVSRNMKSERIDGSITGNKRQMAIDRFQAESVEGRESPFVMLLSTRAGGVGINLTAADTCIIFDSDWNPQNDLQAQARCHRIGQTKSVKVYRLLSRKTYEMQMFHMSSLKMGLDQAVLQGFENGGSGSGEGAMTKDEVERLLRHGAYDIFNEEKSGKAEAESNDFVQQDIDSILERRSRTVIHDNTGSKSNAAGGTFSKASFKAPMAPDGAEKKLSNEDVDIDDPEFWKKMVGEAIVEDPYADIVGKKRKRKAANYSEIDYERRLRDIDQSDSESYADGSASDDWEDDDSQVSTSCLDLTEEGGQPMEAAKKPKREKKKKSERSRWGGSEPTSWEKADVEKLFKALQMYGYGNVPWSDLCDKVQFDKQSGYSVEEVKRMCWTLVLLILREAADDDAASAKRRAERAKEKKRESEGTLSPPAYPNAGGVLGVSPGVEGVPEKGNKDDMDKLNVSFSKLWSANVSWASMAVKDAVAFAENSTPRSKEVLAHALKEDVPKDLREKNSGALALFGQNLWPSLRCRGWKTEVVSEGKYSGSTHYLYEGQQYRSPEAVLNVVPTVHPELSSTVENIVSSAAAAAAAEESARKLEAARTAKTLDPVSPNAQSLAVFLEVYGPLQLVVDRSKSKKIHLSRKVLGACCALHTANALVKLCDGCSGDEFTDKLAKLLYVDKRMALPHPSWTPRHDAVLIRAIAVHGWIEHDSCRRAITEDSTIKWGSPFDDGCGSDVPKISQSISDEEARRKEQASLALRDTAARAAALFNADYEILQELNGINQGLIINAYGLAQQTIEADGESHSSPLWVTDDALLQAQECAHQAKSIGGDNDEAELADLPTKKDLLKRAKAVLGRSVASLTTQPTTQPSKPTEPETVAAPAVKYKYCVLDQGDRCNILLAELLRGLLKTSFAKKGSATKCRKICAYALQESQRRQESLAELSSTKVEGQDGPAISPSDEMQKISEHIAEASRHIKAASRPAKNVLRVMLGVAPVPPKNPSEDLFPVEKKKQLSIISTSEQSSSSKKKRKTDDAHKPQGDKRKKEKDEGASGDRVISRAILRAHSEGTPRKFAEESVPSILELTALETLLLSVVCSQGLPVWTPKWKDLFRDKVDDPQLQGPGHPYAITWHGMSMVVETAAEMWLSAAALKHKEKREAFEKKFPTEKSRESDEGKRALSKVRSSELEETVKRCAVAQAKDYRNDPLKLAKKTIMTLEALRIRMGPVGSKRGGAPKKVKSMNKTENGLGPRVLLWFGNELTRWAQSQCLEVLDRTTGRPLANTASDFIQDKPRYRDGDSNAVFAVFDKKACRTVFTQIAQLSRARSIFLKNTDDEMTKLVQKAIRNSHNADDSWENKPSWWDGSDDASNCELEKDLVGGLLEFGYGGFEEMMTSMASFHRRLEQAAIRQDGTSVEGVLAGSDPKKGRLTKASAQERANQLTRELSVLEDTADMVRMVRERGNHPGPNGSSISNIVSDGTEASHPTKAGGGVQTGIEAFFAAPEQASSPKQGTVIMLSDSDDDSCVVEVRDKPKNDPGGCVEVLEPSSPGKRKQDIFQTESASKKLKTSDDDGCVVEVCGKPKNNPGGCVEVLEPSSPGKRKQDLFQTESASKKLKTVA